MPNYKKKMHKRAKTYGEDPSWPNKDRMRFRRDVRAVRDGTAKPGTQQGYTPKQAQRKRRGRYHEQP